MTTNVSNRSCLVVTPRSVILSLLLTYFPETIQLLKSVTYLGLIILAYDTKCEESYRTTRELKINGTQNTTPAA